MGAYGILEDREYLDLRGIPASGGIWAPCLRYHEEERLFYLLYTNFKSSYTPPFRDQDKRNAGIVLQEYDWRSRQMIGEPKMMFEGTEVGQTEVSADVRKGKYE